MKTRVENTKLKSITKHTLGYYIKVQNRLYIYFHENFPIYIDNKELKPAHCHYFECSYNDECTTYKLQDHESNISNSLIAKSVRKMTSEI